MIKLCMFDHEREALKRITERLKRRFSDRIISIYAFGSRVRGDHEEWSDLDVLVVVKNKDPDIEKGIIDIFTDEEMETGIPFAPVIKDVRVFERERELKTPFYQDIMKEGVLL